MIQYIPYRWVRIVQIYLNQHPVPAKLTILGNKLRKERERRNEK